MNYLESYLKFVTARPSSNPTDFNYTDAPPECIGEEPETDSNEEVLEAASESQPDSDAVVSQRNAEWREDSNSLDHLLSESPTICTNKVPLCPSNQKLEVTAVPRLETNHESSRNLKCNTCEFITDNKLRLRKHYKEIHKLILVKKARLRTKMNGSYTIKNGRSSQSECEDSQRDHQSTDSYTSIVNSHLLVFKQKTSSRRDKNVLGTAIDSDSFTSECSANLVNLNVCTELTPMVSKKINVMDKSEGAV